MLFLPALAVASHAMAQSDTARARNDTARLAPTVITVVRTTLDLARAPYAIGVTTRDEIQRGKPGFALDEALAGIAGVQVDNRFNYALGERISIRGFGARAQFGVRGVRVLLDGIPMTLADGQTSLNNVDVGALARAEVIRGPASAMHGNAAGGVIQLESEGTADIADAAFGGSLRTEVGEHQLARAQLDVAGRRGETSYRLTHSKLTFGGYRRWNTARNDHADLRVSRITDNRSLGLTVNWVDYVGRNPGGLSSALLAADREQAFTNNVRFQTGEQGRQTQIGGTWNEQIGGMRLHLSAHGLEREVDNPIPQRIVVIDRGAGGVRLALSGDPHFGARTVRLSVGSEVQLQHDDRRNFVSLDGARGADTLNQLERVNNTAAFAQAYVELLPRVALMLGARYDRIRFEADDRLIGSGNADDSGERTMSAASPSAGITVNVTQLLDLYSNFSTSFETPTTSELANQESGAGGLNPTLDPQRTRSVEMGINGRLQVPGIAGSFQIAAYDARVRDALIPFEVASVPGRQYFRNAGSTRHRGIETAASLLLPRSLSLRASFTHTDTRFEKYAVTVGATTTTFDGKRVPGVAANRADATVSFQPRRLFLDWDARASSSIPVNDANTERSSAYVIHGARVGVSDIRVGGAKLSPHLGVLNLFARDYNTSVVVNAFGGRFYEPGPPRSFYGGIDARF